MSEPLIVMMTLIFYDLISGTCHGTLLKSPLSHDQRKWEEKVLAFIFDYYMDMYGYAPVRCYGLELDEKGESLVFYANGGFSGPDDDNPYAIKMRRPAVFQMFIPEAERVE